MSFCTGTKLIILMYYVHFFPAKMVMKYHARSTIVAEADALNDLEQKELSAVI